MSKNTITATIPFSFKGKEYTPSSIIDLDVFILANPNIDRIFHLVAQENKIDKFSYEYEVLESSSISFSQATGVAVEFLLENQFDLNSYIEKRNKDEVQEALQNIASEILQVDKLEENQSLAKALLKAYQAGVQSVTSDA